MKNAVTEKLIHAVKHQLRPPPPADEIAFLRDFYHRLSGQDFSANNALVFREAALRHRKLGQVRAPGQTLIAAHNTADIRDRVLMHNGAPAREATIVALITDDRPFLIGSLTMKLNAMRKSPQCAAHPTFAVRRDRRHQMISMARCKDSNALQAGEDALESYVQFAIDFTPPREHPRLLREIREVIDDVGVVVADWSAMRERALGLAQALQRGARTDTEHAALLDWMANDHFAFLGYVEMTVHADADGARAVLDDSSALGVLRAHAADIDAILPPPTDSNAKVVFTKSRQRARVHRDNYMDCILVERVDDNDKATRGKPTGGRRIGCILGFLARAATHRPTDEIPLLRERRNYILKHSTLRPGGHAYKSLVSVIETLPRETMFQMEARDLYALCMTILNHFERRKTRLHLHRNVCGHFYSCLTYLPRDLFDSTLRRRIQSYLLERLGGEQASFDVHFSDSSVTRIHFVIHCRQRQTNKFDARLIERDVLTMARDWNENLHAAALRDFGYQHAEQLLTLYRDAFPGNYRNVFSVDDALIDINRFAQVSDGRMVAALKPCADGEARFMLYTDEQSIALSAVMPILENMGVFVQSEQPYRIRRSDGAQFWLHDFSIVRTDGESFVAPSNADQSVVNGVDKSAEQSTGKSVVNDANKSAANATVKSNDKSADNFRDNFETAFMLAWRGVVENDGFNQLVLLGGLTWRQTALLRAYYRYLKQIRLRYSEQYIIDTLAKHPQLAVLMVRLFDARFNPRERVGKSVGGGGERALSKQIAQQLEQVASLDEERIILALLDVINATLRTNYYQAAHTAPRGDIAGHDTPPERAKSYLSIKLDSRAIPRIPAPAPNAEIFVYSPRIEGVHLRGGAIARGGLRWSERPEDFRTEVLGLVKAQRVKNAVIVPVGSKGGFVAKQLPSERNVVRDEVVACYRLFISGLLDLTDNLVGDKVIAPPQVVRADGDDPYLVVAADKGTATFSDIANELSAQYQFWLGDAFASGGSVGYDHKKMGITARGAWESVKRHFRELGKDIQREEFSVVAIGDMSGDVFGNAMLLSKHIRLLAAFNHRHIFIDPTPPARAHQERKRLFDLPRSSWDDYDRKLISPGGGVFSRAAKSITLSARAKRALGASKDKFAPDELIRVILKCKCELLFNGGIGTYVKASTETDSAAQDKNNDSVRVDANQLRCSTLGEGGNLGMTQLARIEYAQGGGLCYTDAIDNSAGVDTSDHEVNIKILLNAAMRERVNPLSAVQRNALLAKMQDEVGALVLANNYAQTQALGLEAWYGGRIIAQQARAIDALEDKGLLDRAIEFLPTRAALSERAEQNKSLSRPELSVLLSYGKMELSQVLLESNLPDDAYAAREIDRYFPKRLTKQYPKLVRAHRLKREIIAAQLGNDLVGMMGASFHLRLADLSGCAIDELTRAYVAARDLLDAPTFIGLIQSLDNRIDARLQLTLLAQNAAMMRQCIIRLLRNQPAPLNIAKLVDACRPQCAKLKAALPRTLGARARHQHQSRIDELRAANVPPADAAQLAALAWLGNAIDIIEIARRERRALRLCAGVYFEVGELLGLDWLDAAIDALPTGNHWHDRATFGLGNELRASHSAIARKVLAMDSADSGAALLKKWRNANRRMIGVIEEMARELQNEQADFAMLSVLISELAWLH